MDNLPLLSIMLFAAGLVLEFLLERGWAQWRRNYRVRNPIRRFLGFDDRLHVIIVYPPRDTAGDNRILPQVAAEDFAAVNNVIRLLDDAGWPRARVHVCDWKRYQRCLEEETMIDDLPYSAHNRICICSPKPESNPVTGTTLEELGAPASFELVDESEWADPLQPEYRIRFFEVARKSLSYGQQVTERRSATKKVHPHISDAALVLKAPLPAQAAGLRAGVLIIAGIRGIGTWGAADFLRKRWGELSTPNFAALMRSMLSRLLPWPGLLKRDEPRVRAFVLDITYHNFDILTAATSIPGFQYRYEGDGFPADASHYRERR
jgi:hypothetical protein